MPAGDFPADDDTPTAESPPVEDAYDGGTSPTGDVWAAPIDCQLGGDWPDSEPTDAGPLAGPAPWPEVPPILPPGPAGLKNLPPAGSGFLDLRIPWLTLARNGPEPGYLTRLGPITPAQARYLACLACADPGVQWRVVLTGDTSRAMAVTRIRRGRSPDGFTPAGVGDHCSLVRLVTVTMPTSELSAAPGSRPGVEPNLAEVLAVIVTAARQAADHATERARADAAAGGCAHTQASSAYQVPARLREYIEVRDLTCRFPTCRQPAWRCDCDHTRPFDQDGPTCCCNLGPLCRYHHKLKQLDGWSLDQPAPGTFTWTTPAGRTYTSQPDRQAA
jgi:hypothetical protein